MPQTIINLPKFVAFLWDIAKTWKYHSRTSYLIAIFRISKLIFMIGLKTMLNRLTSNGISSSPQILFKKTLFLRGIFAYHLPLI